jgi:DNA-binding transcriptional LysR family regulator
VNLHVHVDTPEPLFAEIRANTLDVACYLQGRTPPGLAVASLVPEELVIFASPQHPLAGRRHITPAELSEHALVLSGLTFSRELFEAKLRAVGVTPRVVSEAGNYDAVNELVDRNAGYTLNIKAVVAADIAAGRFVPLRLQGPPILGEIVAAFGARSVASPLIQEFIRFMRVELNRPPDASASDVSARTGRRHRTAPSLRPRRQR